MLDFIHRERKMSFNHWRYRLLHWVLEEEAETPERSHLPQSLYKHYCPLFWLTNLFVVLLPVIITLKVASFLVTTFSPLLINFSSYLCSLLPKKAEKEKKKTKEESAEAVINKQKDKLRKKIPGFIAMWLDARPDEDSFLDFYNFISDKSYDIDFPYIGDLSEEEFKESFDSLYPKVKARLEDIKKKRNERQARINVWIVWAEPIFKIFAYAIAATFAIGVIWFLIKFVPFFIGGVIWFVSSFFSIDFAFCFYLLFVATLIVAAMVGIIALVFLVFKGLKKPAYALVDIMGAAAESTFSAIGHQFNCLLQFFADFYANSCPPINIVSEEDEAVENIE